MPYRPNCRYCKRTFIDGSESFEQFDIQKHCVRKSDGAAQCSTCHKKIYKSPELDLSSNAKKKQLEDELEQPLKQKSWNDDVIARERGPRVRGSATNSASGSNRH